MSEGGRRLAIRLGPLLLLGAIAVGLLQPNAVALQLDNPDRTRVSELRAALARLPDDPLVIVGFDPDLGTYAEIRATVRALFADLLRRDARLALVSLTPEGRALAVAELGRLGRLEASSTRLQDLGFRPGAEAALVSLTRGGIVSEGGGSIARRLAEDGLAGVDLALVVGGNDLGPRAWVEQVGTRVPGLPLVAVAPTILLPELQPYLGTGQLEALLATVRDGAAYRASVDLGRLARLAEQGPPGPLPFLAGMLAAVLVLGQAAGARVFAGARSMLPRDVP
ncbi:MAG: hypothetical protein ACRDGV_04605 [Candidatus Limnocylindria bacterium]